jgi:beta-lactamase superfamily II metal-dependent hydrolase
MRPSRKRRLTATGVERARPAPFEPGAQGRNRSAVALLALALAASSLHAQQLELRFLDVGQADAAVIREGGKTALIDAGRSAGVVSQLRALGITMLDLVVASHNHADHIGGMTGVLGGLTVRYYMDNGVPHTTATYQRTIQAVQTSGAQYLRPTARVITLGAARLRVLPPPARDTDQNNSSIGILVEYGAFRALFTGDSELAELAHWLAHDSIPPVNVVKVAHHGSWNGTSDAWARTTRPQAAVISVGTNSYGHPHARALAQWRDVGARIYRTDVDGTVLCLANKDGSFVITTERADTTGVFELRPFVQAEPPPVEPRVDVAPSCCKICRKGKACGNSCISRRYTCRRPPGCACDAR